MATYSVVKVRSSALNKLCRLPIRTLPRGRNIATTMTPCRLHFRPSTASGGLVLVQEPIEGLSVLRRQRTLCENVAEVFVVNVHNEKKGTEGGSRPLSHRSPEGGRFSASTHPNDVLDGLYGRFWPCEHNPCLRRANDTLYMEFCLVGQIRLSAPPGI